MKDSEVFPDLDAAIADELERLKKLPASLLRVLRRDGVTVVIRVRAQSYEVRAWSVPAPAGSFAVLVGAFEPGSPGPTHLRGFLAKADQTYADLTEHEVRTYE